MTKETKFQKTRKKRQKRQKNSNKIDIFVSTCRTVDVHPPHWSSPPRPIGPSITPQENSPLEWGKLLGWDQVQYFSFSVFLYFPQESKKCETELCLVVKLLHDHILRNCEMMTRSLAQTCEMFTRSQANCSGLAEENCSNNSVQFQPVLSPLTGDCYH